MERIVSLSAVGSLKEEHEPLEFVIPDQFFDRTRGRVSTFFGDGLVAHISFADPVCPQLAEVVAAACQTRAWKSKQGGTYLCMEGPAFSTKAESNIYRSWGMDVIGMTNLQEAKLAREAEICYVTVAMVTDYDCWHEEHDAVTVTDILANLNQNAANACKVVAATVAAMPAERSCKCGAALKHALDHRSQGDPRRHAQETGAPGWQISRLTKRPGNCWAPVSKGNRNPTARSTACCSPTRARPSSALWWKAWPTGLNRACATATPGCSPRPWSEPFPARTPARFWTATPRVRQPRTFQGNAGRVQNVFVLSRVTLGADVAVTSVVLDAAKKRFPEASICFAGPEKNWELFAADPMLEHLPLAYGRDGTLAERLAAWPALRDAVNTPASLVIDPDSRLTQLGLLPVCAEEDYFFFESRSYGDGSEASLTELTRDWVASTFGVADAKPFIAPLRSTGGPGRHHGKPRRGRQSRQARGRSV